MKKRKIILGTVIIVLLMVVLSFATDIAGVRTYVANAIGFNDSLNIDNLPKIQEKFDNYILFDDGNLYRLEDDLLILVSNNIDNIYLRNDYNIIFMDKDKNLQFSSLETWSPQLIASNPEILAVRAGLLIKEENGLISVVSNTTSKTGSYSKKAAPTNIGNIIDYTSTSSYLNDEGQYWIYKVSFDGPSSYVLERENVSHFVYLKNYKYIAASKSMSDVYGYYYNNSDTIYIESNSYKLKDIGNKYFITSGGTLYLWGDLAPYKTINNVDRVVYEDDLYIEFITNDNQYNVYKIYDGDSYKNTTYIGIVGGLPYYNKEYFHGYRQVVSYQLPEKPAKVYRGGYYINGDGELKYYNHTDVIDKNIMGVLTGSTTRFYDPNKIGEATTYYYYYNYYVDQNGNLYSLSNEKKTLIADGIAYVDEKNNYFIDNNGNYYTLIENEIYKLKFSKDEEISTIGLIITSNGYTNFDVGDTTQYSATQIPVNSQDKVTYITNNEEVAKIDQNGLMTMIKDGVVHASAVAKSGFKVDYPDVTVYPLIERISISDDYNGVYVIDYTNRPVCFDVYPENTRKGLDFTIQYNENYYMSSPTHKEGTQYCANINTSSDALNVPITIKANHDESINDTIYINIASSLTTLKNKMGVKFKYKDLLLDVNDYKSVNDMFSFASEDYAKTIIFESDNPEVATIDKNGVITAHSMGEATMSLKVKDLNRTGDIVYTTIDTIKIKVEDIKAELEGILENVPDMSEERYDSILINEKYKGIIEGLSDEIQKYDYEITLKENNVFTLSLNKTAQNGNIITVSKDITILEVEPNEIIDNLTKTYDLDLYETFINNKDLIGYVQKKISNEFNSSVTYEVRNASYVTNYLVNSVTFDLVVNINNNHYYLENFIVNATAFINVPYEVRTQYEAIEYVRKLIQDDSRFENAEIYVTYGESFIDINKENLGTLKIYENYDDQIYLTILRLEKPITNIELEYDETDFVIYGEKCFEFKPLITPATAIYEQIDWTLDDYTNAHIWTESDNVKICTDKAGTYTLNASTNNGKFTKKWDFTFTNPNPKEIVRTYRGSNVIYYLYDDGSVFASGTFYKLNGSWTESDKAEYLRSNVKDIILSEYSYNDLFITTNDMIISNRGKNLPKINNIKTGISINNYDNTEYIILTDNGDIYTFTYNQDNLTKIDLTNVKQIKKINNTIFALTNDNSLYVWKNNIFGEKFNNGEYISSPLKLIDNVKKFDYRYALTNNKELYYWHSMILNPTLIDSNIEDILYYLPETYDYEGDWDPLYYEKENTGYKNIREFNNKYVTSNSTYIDTNIKQIYTDYFYLHKNGTLNYWDYKNINNVKEIKIINIGNEEIFTYITNDNKLYQILRTYDKLINSYDYESYLLANNIDTFVYDDMLRTTDGDLWSWNDAAYGAVNMVDENGIKYPARVLNEMFTDPVPVKGIYIYPGTTKHISVGDTLDILAVVLPYNATNKNVTWSVNDNNLADISSDGVLNAKSEGIVTVSVSSEDGKYTSSMDIEIHPLPNNIIINKEVNTYLYSYDNYENYIGNLCVDIKPDNTLIRNLTWTSSNEDIVKINSMYTYYNGEYDNCVSLDVLPNTIGDVTITAETEDGKYSDNITLHIIPSPQDYSFYINDYQVAVGGTTKVILETNPSDYPKEYYSFVIPDKYKDIISIDTNGIITGNKTGEAQVELHFIGKDSLLINDNEYYPSSYIEVVDEDIEISFDVEKIYMHTSGGDFTDRGTMYANFYRGDNNNSTIIWTSSDESILKLLPSTDTNHSYDSSTNIAIGNKTGTVTVTAKSSDGKYSDSLTYHVVNVNYPTDEIVLDIAKGEIHNIGKYASDIGITNDYWYFYESEDESIAIVDDYGKVTPIKEGTTYIRTATYVLNSIRDDDDIKIIKIPVKIVNSANIKSLKIDPSGGKYSGQLVTYGNKGNTISIPKPTKSYILTLIDNTTTNLNVSANFTGWELSGGGTLVNDIYTYGDSNGTLTAKWSYNKVNLPKPTKSGYTFVGWFTDNTYKTPFNSNTVIDKNMTLYAKFIKNTPVNPSNPNKPLTPSITRGDANNDGKITALDYVKVKNHIMKSSIITNANELYGADMNADGTISALDYVAIKNKIMRG